MRSRDEAIEVLNKLFRNERLRVYKIHFRFATAFFNND